MNIRADLAADRRRIDAALRRFLPSRDSVPPTVRRAMAYSLFPGGKRLRPALALAACRALGGRIADILPAAASIEMIHTYSLIHDDLPALDNDDMRRGRASSHRVFGEAMAILAGDALLTHAFEVLSIHPKAPRLARRKIEVISLLARSAGVTGMIAGQVMDLEAEGKPCSRTALIRMHRGKTGALISAAVQVGGIVAGGKRSDLGALARYGDGIGLAFQIVDDLLDQEGSSERLGKTAGKDRVARKATFPDVLGVDASRRRALEEIERAVAAIDPLGRRGAPLAALAHFIVRRAS
jgi:geranylgeranyl diphosphate synthase type II